MFGAARALMQRGFLITLVLIAALSLVTSAMTLGELEEMLQPYPGSEEILDRIRYFEEQLQIAESLGALSRIEALKEQFSDYVIGEYPGQYESLEKYSPDLARTLDTFLLSFGFGFDRALASKKYKESSRDFDSDLLQAITRIQEARDILDMDSPDWEGAKTALSLAEMHLQTAELALLNMKTETLSLASLAEDVERREKDLARVKTALETERERLMQRAVNSL